MIVTGFKSIDVMNEIACPTCGQPSGKMCTRLRSDLRLGQKMKRGGDQLTSPHAPRVEEYDRRHPDRVSLYQGDPCDPSHREVIRQYNEKEARL